MNASEVKDALRSRHPAIDPLGGPGPWTCIAEWMNIDLLAVSAWASVKPYPRYGRVGYEVKVSRSDYKRELAKPGKRAAAVAFCHEFYFAVPHGLLKAEEVQWTPPWGFDSVGAPFERPRCPGAYGYACLSGRARRLSRFRADRQRGSTYSGSPDYRNDLRIDAVCPTCWGTGWIAESPAVRAGAPRLWIPDDVGLVVVYEGGRCVTAKKAPRRDPGRRAGGEVSLLGPLVHGRQQDGIAFTDHQLAELIRWVSYRPDPRHVAHRAGR